MYGKLFAQMYDGTLGTRGPWQALVTFQQLIILADKTGIVDMTPEAISRRTTIPLEIVEIGLRELEKPDDGSRSPEEEGRRIVHLDAGRPWGWRIVNYEKYRKLRNEDERREYHRQYWREKRSKTQQNSKTQRDSTNGSKQYAVSSKEEKKRADARATRFALSSLPEEWKDYCKSKRPDLDPASVFDAFKDFWSAKAGQGGTKLDWAATWRLWVRNEKESRASPKQDIAALIAELEAKEK